MAETSVNQPIEDRPFINFAYICKSWTGRLKLAELFFSLLAGALVPATVYKHSAAFGFMSFVAWTAFIAVTIDILLHLSYLWEKLTLLSEYPEIMFCLCAMGVLGFAIASVTELAVAVHAENPNLPSASAVFGFVCMGALLVECWFHYRNYNTKSAERKQRQEATYEQYQADDSFSEMNDV